MATQETYQLNEWDSAAPAWGDKELTLSFQRGDRGAYDSIYQRHSARVRAICLRMLADPQDAEDAAQETFLRVYQALPRFNGRYQLGAWINRIATNVCLDYLRARRRAPAEAAPNEVLEDSIDVDLGEGPEEAVLRSAEGARVQDTLATLTPIQRTAILMRDFEGLPYSDIASSLGVTECRARVLIHRARKGFRKSWSSSWVLLFPTRLLGRLRRLTTPVTEQVACAATSAAHGGGAGPIVSCTQFLQQCGEAVAQRLAPVATAAMVGAAGASAPVAIVGPDVLREPVRAASALPGVLGSAFQAAEEVTGELGLEAAVASAEVGTGAPSDLEVPPADGADAADDSTAPVVAIPPATSTGEATIPVSDATTGLGDDTATGDGTATVDETIPGGDDAPVGVVEVPEETGSTTGEQSEPPTDPTPVPAEEPAPTDPAAETAPAGDSSTEESGEAPTDGAAVEGSTDGAQPEGSTEGSETPTDSATPAQ
jgi:RNA polymerase sigma-70 factor (ECF subfamily)